MKVRLYRKKRGHKPWNEDYWLKRVMFDSESLWSFADQYFIWRKERNYSEATIKHARYALKQFFDWCEVRGVTKPAEISPATLDRYQKYLYRKPHDRTHEPISFSTQYRSLSALKQFFKWLTRRGYIACNPASEIELPRLDRRLPKHILSREEVEKVLMAVDVSDGLGIRNRAIIETFYSTGMRRSELTRLKLYDVDLNRGTVMIRLGKGRKDRLIPIGSRAVRWIEKYLLDVRPQWACEPECGALFISIEGGELYPETVSHIVRDHIEKADIGKKGACHLFRHAMATLMHENGADIRFVAQMLGHSDLQSTEIYTHVNVKRLKEIHEATHPAETGLD